jgi:choline kinase
MKAVILAAGVGRRLHTLTQHHPKCLIPIGEKPLLVRYLNELEAVGVSKVTIIVGYKHELIRDAVASWSGSIPVSFLVNEDYKRGSIVSLWVAREVLDDDTVVMDADVLFHPSILQRLVKSSHSNALLMDETVVQDPESREECMVVVQHGRVIALSKQMPDTYDDAGEGVGFLKLSRHDAPSLLKSVEQRIIQGQLDIEYEDALQDFFGTTAVGVEKIGGLPWIEIDFPEDVARAQNDVLPKLPEHGRE